MWFFLKKVVNTIFQAVYQGYFFGFTGESLEPFARILIRNSVRKNLLKKVRFTEISNPRVVKKCLYEKFQLKYFLIVPYRPAHQIL